MTLKKLQEKGLIPEGIDYHEIYKDNSFSFEKDGKHTFKKSDGTILFKDATDWTSFRDYCEFEKDNKWSVILYDGTFICKDADWTRIQFSIKGDCVYFEKDGLLGQEKIEKKES